MQIPTCLVSTTAEQQFSNGSLFMLQRFELVVQIETLV